MSDDSKKNLQTQLKLFWQKQAEDIKKLCEENSDFKNHNDLPLARIKRIMKSDEDVRMIRAEAPVLFAKACELFILELTLRAYCNSENTDRRNLQKEDIFAAVKNTDIFDFLDDVLTEKVQLEAEKAKAAAAAASLKSES
jgi:nuclear transcription factor Y, gamma|eukprot:g1912.t1